MRPNQGTKKICIVFLLIEILLTLRRIACEQLTPPYQDINMLPKILKIFNNEISLCYFFVMSLVTIHWPLSDNSLFLSFHFYLPNQLNKSTLCKMIPLVALATSPCSIV